MKTLLHILLLALFFSFYSCDKNSPEKNIPVSYPYKMFVKDVRIKGGLRLYSNKTGIINATVKRKFIEDAASLFNINDSVNGEDSIIFESSEKAIFPVNLDYSVTTMGDQLLFKSFGSYLTNVGDFIDGLILHTDAPANAGYIPSVGSYYIHDFHVAYGNMQELRLSMFAYKLAHWVKSGSTVYTYSSNSGRILNEFNKTFIQKLSETDTIAVQAFEVILRP